MHAEMAEGSVQNGYRKEDGLLWQGRLLCVPHGCRRSIFESVHSTTHTGVKKSLRAIRSHFTWPGITVDVAKWAEQCDVCQRNKTRTAVAPQVPMPMPLPQEKWLDVGMDFAFVTPSNATDPKQSAFKIPSKSGPDSFFVYVDYTTRYTVAVPMRSMDTAEDIYDILFSQIWTRYGQPCRIVSDRDGRFLSKWWQNRLKSLGIKIAKSSP